MNNTKRGIPTQTHSYRILGWVTAALFFYLFVSALFFSRSFVGDLGVELNESALFLCRRAALLLLLISALAFLARNAPHSDARQAILLAISISMTGLAGLGLFEFLRGFVGAAMLFPVTVELLVALFHFRLWFVSRKADGAQPATAPSA